MWNASTIGTTNLGVSLDIATAANQVSGRFCEIKRTTAGVVSMAVEALDSGVPIDTQSQPSQQPYDAEHPFQLEWSRAVCEVSTSSAIETMAPPPYALFGRYVGLRIDHGDINLAWIAALRTSCP